MAPNPHIKRAFEAMKGLGFEEARVRPVLKKLLKLYDRNWELISEDNFRALAEAILDDQETEDVQEKKGKKKKMEEEESRAVEVYSRKKKAPEPAEEDDDGLAEPEHPLKRQRRRGGGSAQTLDGSPSPSFEVPVANEPKEQRVENRESSSLSLPAQPVVTVPASICKFIIPKDEPFTDDMPLSVIHQDSYGKGSSSGAGKMNGNADNAPPEQNGETGGNADKASPSAVEKSNEHKLDAVSDEASAVELASSPLGEVKISLSFSSAPGGQNFCQPSLDDLLRAMEEKCLRTYKILDPNFSVRNLMNDMCSCYLELATDSANLSREKLPSITSNLDVLKNAATRSAVFSSGITETSSQMRGVEYGEVGVADSDSRGLVVVPECQISADDWRSINIFSDITQGEEMVEIPWANEVNNELLPPFRYIAQSLVFQDATVKFTLSNIGDAQCCSSCFGDCLASPKPCNCAIAVSGFAYTSDGLLQEEFLAECISMVRDPQNQCLQMCKECPLEKAKKEEILGPCKGHLKRKVIKECWSKCGCNANCDNRVVQRRVRNKLQVFFTPNGKGWGLRTLEKLPKGAFVCEFTGEILTIAELYERGPEKSTSTVILDAYWGSEDGGVGNDKALCLDGMQYGNVARFINHRCLDANLIEVPVHVESPDHHYYHLAFFTTQEIDAMEELTWDYGVNFKDDNYPLKTFRCLCGSEFCRNMKGANKAKNVLNTA